MRHSMQRNETAYFMENCTEVPARLVNVLFDIVALREIFLVVTSLWIYTRGSDNEFRPHEFVEGLERVSRDLR